MTAAIVSSGRTTARRSGGAVAADVAALAAGVLLLLAVVAAVWPGLLAHGSPLDADRSAVLRPPSAAHWFGTDEIGRDVYTRVVHGTASSLGLGVGAVAIGVVGGVLLGVLGAIGGRVVSVVVLRLTDIGAAFPELLMAILFITLFGSGLRQAVLAIGFAAIPYYARVVRAEVLRIRSTSYVEAARALGLPRHRVLLAHVLPNALRPVVVLMTIGIGAATLAGAGLGFLGLGAPPPAPEWGAMLSNARAFMTTAWWSVVFPGLAITLLVLSTTVVGRRVQARAEGR